MTVMTSNQSSFVDVLRRFTADDNREGTDKITTHSYGELYEEVMSRLAAGSERAEVDEHERAEVAEHERAVGDEHERAEGDEHERAEVAELAQTRVLEIGVYSGAFLKAVCDFLPCARAFGIDIDTTRLQYSDPRMAVYQADATKPAFLDLLGDQHYDLIVDDASHVPEHQLATLDLAAPLLKPGGTYIIEDIVTDDLEKRLRSIAEAHGLTLRMLDLRSIKGRYDDLVAILERPCPPAAAP